MKQSLYLSILCIAIISCTVLPQPKIDSDCKKVEPRDERFYCYRNEIHDLITWQITSDYRDYARNRNPSEIAQINSITAPRNITVEVRLSLEGKVDRVIIKDSSRNIFFDQLVEQSILQTGPFNLPEDMELKKQLLVFPYSIGFL